LSIDEADLPEGPGLNGSVLRCGPLLVWKSRSICWAHGHDVAAVVGCAQSDVFEEASDPKSETLCYRFRLAFRILIPARWEDLMPWPARPSQCSWRPDPCL
jgi:hypothetical protein